MFLPARRGVCRVGQQQFHCLHGILVSAYQRLADDVIRELGKHLLDLPHQQGQVPHRGHQG
jgi:hypothetical protein